MFEPLGCHQKALKPRESTASISQQDHEPSKHPRQHSNKSINPSIPHSRSLKPSRCITSPSPRRRTSKPREVRLRSISISSAACGCARRCRSNGSSVHTGGILGSTRAIFPAGTLAFGVAAAVGHASVLRLLALVEGDCLGVFGGIGDLAAFADAGPG